MLLSLERVGMRIVEALWMLMIDRLACSYMN